ncbi:diaminopimelate decarboxylase [Pseudonocardia thermophila]|jgi:Diaminopimelate decarboxylase|uniref:Diaminopimelate decarboxylase n=1 Tax=Pseudonocardia thermophila TaxID=1848 RepID=A0A1M6R540_PSETH|nr:alanine racemase [Pseudonocardia thermophila]SHK27563.1 diaminopimelate decarboxylase [Pseudonocardia thermophila]
MITDLVAKAAREAPLPAYVYDLDHLDAHMAAIAAAVRTGPGRVEIHYAAKANPDPGVLATVARHVDGIEVASGGELAHVRDVLGPDVPIAFGGPGKTDEELAAAARQADRVHVESRLEVRRLAAAARAAGTRVKALLRVNVPGGVGGVLRMGGGPSPFGMDPAEADACLAELPPEIELLGVHAHLASGLDAQACAAQGRTVLDWAAAFAARHGVGLAEVVIGGGMHVDYTRPAERFDWAAYRAALRLPDHGPLVRIEPGRALTAYSGWYVTDVLDLKRSAGEWFAICRGGTHHLRTPVAKGHDQPFTVLPTGTGPTIAGPVTVVGQLCTPKDVLARRVPVERIGVGDRVAFALAGAYALNISHRDFLMHPPPALVRVGGGADQV